MKKVDLGQTVNTLANLGVIAGIIFLGFELRQTQVVGEAQTRNEIARMFMEQGRSDIDDGMIEVVVLAGSGQQLDQLTQAKGELWADIYLQLFENLHYQNTRGLYTQEEYDANHRRMRSFLNAIPFFRQRFCAFPGNYSASFQDLVLDLLEEPCE